ncbi:Yae1 family protein [Chloroflexota bacterium]
MKTSLLLLCLIVVFSLILPACSTGSYGEGYNAGFEEGYSKGFQDGRKKGIEETETPAKIPTPSSPTKPATKLEKITLADAEYILNFTPLLPSSFSKVDAASEGMSKADLKMPDYTSEVQLFLRDDPFQMVYGMIMIIDSAVERASFDSIMKNEAMIQELLTENIIAGVKEEGVDLDDIELSITNPALGDLACLGEGFMHTVGLTAGFDTLWIKKNKVYAILYASYHTSNRETLLPIGEEVLRRISQYSQ